MFIIEGNKVILRDFIERDIDDYITWNTSCIEWKQWDAPWEFDENDHFNSDEYREQKVKYLTKVKDKTHIRSRLEICLNDSEQTHIGWVSSYNIDEEFKYTEIEGLCTVGIDIPDPIFRTNGHGTESLKLFLGYLSSKGYSEFYTQTWSGNAKMIGLAHKLGFKECNRYKGIRVVRDEIYDGLTFKLNSK